MTPQETKRVLAVLAAAYPQFYANKPKADIDIAVNLWARQFADTDYNLVGAAVDAFIASDTKGFPPAIGQIKEQIMRMYERENGLPSETEAWAMVKRAVRNGYYGYPKEWAKLPKIVQECIGEKEMLRDWSDLPTETIDSVVASNFMRTYRAKAEKEREYQKLPERVKVLFAKLDTVDKLLTD